jgi:cytochrome c oxidase subunit 1
MSTGMTDMVKISAGAAEGSYLTDGWTLRSWLLSTDHKRIALLYLGSITFFFFIGGAAAALVRLNLIVPEGLLGSAEAYNRLFTMHGVIMVWFFLVPAVPVTLGNFLIPLMLGARDLAFPRLNLFTWYLFITGGAITLWALFVGGVDTGWTFYTPLSTTYSQGPCGAGGGRHLHLGIRLHCHGPQFHRQHSPAARPRFNVVSHARVPVVDIFLECLAGPRDSRARHHLAVARLGTTVSYRCIRPCDRRRPVAVPAFILVLLASRGLHHDPPGLRRRQRDHSDVFAQEHLRLQIRRVGERISIAVISFFVWGHHMFVAGTSVYSAVLFSILSYLVAVPSAIKVFNWLGTMHKGFVRFDAPMLYALGFIGLFTIGG